MRRPPQLPPQRTQSVRRGPRLGQNPRPLHENATRRSARHAPHRNRANPSASPGPRHADCAWWGGKKPHARKAWNSSSTKRGTPSPSRRCAASAGGESRAGGCRASASGVFRHCRFAVAPSAYGERDGRSSSCTHGVSAGRGDQQRAPRDAGAPNRGDTHGRRGTACESAREGDRIPPRCLSGRARPDRRDSRVY